ncbi:MAG: hypothetical protein K2M98_02180 [Muribaculum sp.]|nr:hypothetical protein [Muribaculum sp.]
MYKRNIQLFTSAVCAGILMLTMPSCDKDNNVINEEFEVVTPGDGTDQPVVEKVTYPAAIIGNLGDAESELKNCFTNIVEPQDAKIILIESGSIDEYETMLSNAYDNGCLIAVFNPDGVVVSDWSERNNIFYAGPEKKGECSIYGFNNAGTYYSLHTTNLIDDEDVPLFHFCSWVNTVSGSQYQGVNLRTQDIRKRYMPQRVTHTFNISLDEKQLIDEHWANPEQLSLSTTANVTYTIYPIYVFDENASGEYYAIEAEMVLHNSPLNNGNWVRRRGDELTQICGFYLNHCNITANLLRKSNSTFVESHSHGFAEGATSHPASSADATAYNPGFDWAIDATVSGGVPDNKDNHKLTTYGHWTWSNTANATLPGIMIKNNGNTSNVDYTLLVNGLPSATDNLAVAAIPDMSTGDITFKYSWIWHVADIAEGSDERLYMEVGINPVYQAYQWITAGKMTVGEFGNDATENKSTFKFPLTPPNRVATCSTIIRNSSEASYYVRDIKLWRNTTTDSEPYYVVPQTIATSTATGGSGVNATMLILPVGDYTIKGIRYSMENDTPVDEHVIVNTTPITLSAAGNITIDFGSDIFTVM